jgi:serine/threonine protein kinase
MSTRQKDEKLIFEAASELKTPEEQTAYVEKVCAADPALKVRILALLEAHEGKGDFLEALLDEPSVSLDDPELKEEPGTIVGRYKLLEKIGEGGMAVVYMAEQEKPIRRKVALKIIKLGMDTKSVIARFEAERQALAMMDHPNIAKVLDAGATETGRPYFVMELVTGVSITEYCDKNNLNTKNRLALFIEVCNAVQHAHQKGIIHRDIKPTNVMVTRHEGKPIPKVIDFGIAKATNQRLTEKTLFTRYAHIIGTPAYMSPEQADMGDLDVDTRSDIYSLGVLLYELLTGTTPFSEEELRKAGYIEMQRVIREQQPPKPSTKLSTLGKTLTDVAKYRNSTPDLLTKAIRGDLDWIVMKSLEKDRDRRYEGVSSFALDIKRYLEHKPVLAHAPNVTYRLSKFIQRHRTTVTVVLIVLVFVAILSTVLFAWSHKQQQWDKQELSRHRQALSEAERSFDLGDLATSLMQARPLVNSKHVKHKVGILIDNILTRARNKVDYYTELIESMPEEAENYFHRAEHYDILGEEEKVHHDMAQYTTIASHRWSSDFEFGFAKNLGPNINSPFHEVRACVSSDGLSLIFMHGESTTFGDFCMANRLSKTAVWDAPKTYGSRSRPDVNLPVNDVTSWWTADRLEMPTGYKRFDGHGGFDIWMYLRDSVDDNWGSLINLGPVINSASDERSPAISRDGLELYFDAYDRPGSLGGWDLWVTKRATRDAPWQEPENLGEKVNSTALDARPCLSSDGLMLFFDSKRPGVYGQADLYVTRRKTPDHPWEEAVNLGPFINTPAYEECAYISADGSTLYFDSNRPDGYGGQDIWQASIISLGNDSGGEDQRASISEETDKEVGKEVLPQNSK